MILTFKEYLDSKKRLVEAIQTCPIQYSHYEVTKYCKLVIMHEMVKQTILLKPKQTVMVEWKYEDITNPTPLSITITDNRLTETASTKYNTSWKGVKLSGWLRKNTLEQIQN